MAKIVEEIVVIKFSKIAKDSDAETTEPTITSSEVIAALEQVAQELVGNSVVVEVEKA